jgi:hypothetical protein
MARQQGANRVCQTGYAHPTVHFQGIRFDHVLHGYGKILGPLLLLVTRGMHLGNIQHPIIVMA